MSFSPNHPRWIFLLDQIQTLKQLELWCQNLMNISKRNFKVSKVLLSWQRKHRNAVRELGKDDIWKIELFLKAWHWHWVCVCVRVCGVSWGTEWLWGLSRTWSCWQIYSLFCGHMAVMETAGAVMAEKKKTKKKTSSSCSVSAVIKTQLFSFFFFSVGVYSSQLFQLLVSLLASTQHSQTQAHGLISVLELLLANIQSSSSV